MQNNLLRVFIYCKAGFVANRPIKIKVIIDNNFYNHFSSFAAHVSWYEVLDFYEKESAVSAFGSIREESFL